MSKKNNTKRRDSKGRILEKGETERKSGGYDYRFTDRSGKRHSIYASSLVDLRQKEKEIIEKVTSNIDLTGDKISVNQMFETYMKGKTKLAVKTKNGYYNAWRLHVKDSWFGTLVITDVKKSDVLRFYNDLYEDGLSVGYIEIIHHALSPTFELAIDDNYISRNPFRNCLKELRNNNDDEEIATKVLSIKEQEIFFEFAKYNVYLENYYYLFVIMVETCLRIGEVLGLTWNDISLKKGELSITHQLQYLITNGNYNFSITPPKNKQSIRKIILSEKAKKAFLALKKLSEEPTHDKDFELDGYKNFIFVSKNGSPIKPATIGRTLNSLVKKYNERECKLSCLEEREAFLLPHIHPHMLRHTGCTRLAESGIDPKALQLIMGHSDINITMNIYNHCDTERIRSEMKRLGLTEKEAV